MEISSINLWKDVPTVTVRSLTEEIGKWEELYKKYLNDPDNNNCVITYLSQTSWSVKSSEP